MPTVAAAARAGPSGAEGAGVRAVAVILQGPVGVILTHPARGVAKIARHVSVLGAELIVFWQIHRGVPLTARIPAGATVRERHGSIAAQTRPLWQFVWAISRRICVGHNCASRSRSIVPAGRIWRPWNVLQYLPRHARQLGDFHRDPPRLVARGQP